MCIGLNVAPIMKGYLSRTTTYSLSVDGVWGIRQAENLVKILMIEIEFMNDELRIEKASATAEDCSVDELTEVVK